MPFSSTKKVHVLLLKGTFYLAKGHFSLRKKGTFWVLEIFGGHVPPLPPPPPVPPPLNAAAASCNGSGLLCIISYSSQLSLSLVTIDFHLIMTNIKIMQPYTPKFDLIIPWFQGSVLSGTHCMSEQNVATNVCVCVCVCVCVWGGGGGRPIPGASTR